MKNPISQTRGIKAQELLWSSSRSLLALVFLFSGWVGSAGATLQSPKGEEVFGSQAIIVVPKKTVTIGWSYPVYFETPDLVFKVYHTTNLSQPPQDWALLTNVPGNVRSTVVIAEQQQEFFLLTASNYLGESDFATN